jgi:hypothetical protein
MAGLYFYPTNEIAPNPDLELDGVYLPYSDIVESLGSYIYIINKMRVAASSMAQVSQIFTYSYKDANGNYQARVYNVAISKVQYQPVKILDVDMVFDGKSKLEYNVLGGETVNLYFSGRAYQVSDLRKVGGDIEKLKKMEGMII